MTKGPQPSPRGRPRNPDGPTATERAALARAAVISAGGRRLSILLSAQASAALNAIRERGDDRSDTAAIERLLLAAVRAPDCQNNS